MARCSIARRGARCRWLCTVPVNEGTGVPEMGAAESLRLLETDLIKALKTRGYFVKDGLLGSEKATAMRRDAEKLYSGGRFAASLSVDEEGRSFAKEGVLSTELEADDFPTAPHCLAYTRDVLLTLPELLNKELQDRVSTSVYGTKLAVTLPGARYPKHLDNACGGGVVDHRWITCIYYLNPGWSSDAGGDLRLFVDDDGPLDVAPLNDRLVIFFADRLVHEVLPSTTDDHRYALTLWLCSRTAVVGDDDDLCAANRPGGALRRAHFPSSD